MLRSLPVILAVLLMLPVRADEPLTVKIANADIKIPLPVGMVDYPVEDAKAVNDMTPTDCELLRACIEADVLDRTKPHDPSANVMDACVYSLKDVHEDIYSGDFIDFVSRTSNVAVHGVLRSANSSFDFEEMQKRLDAFQKDTGIAMQPDGALYSLGMVSRSGGCVSFMTARYVTVVQDGKPVREKCLTVEGYLLLNNKVVVVLTTLQGPAILNSDILPLKHAAEKFQIALQILNG
jgi:hypothetical protein